MANTFHFIKADSSIKHSQINIQNGNLIQASAIVELNTKDSAEGFANEVTKFFYDNHLIDVNNDKFQYYINQSVLILRLNDSETKRRVLKDLLQKKFSGKEHSIDDSDAPTTIALHAMKYLTDRTIKRLCAFRLLTNVIPSILSNEDNFVLPSIKNFIKQNGMMDQAEIMNLRRLGIVYDMNVAMYSLDGILEYLDNCNQIPNLDVSNDSFVLSSCLSPAGVELTDIALVYFLNLKEEYKYWLPTENKTLHIKGLMVDEDVIVNKNLAAYGTVSSGGRAATAE